MTLKIKVGSLALAEARDVSLPQEFAAWHQTVRVEPGTYDVFAYLDREGGGYRVRQLSAECEGVTVSSRGDSHRVLHRVSIYDPQWIINWASRSRSGVLPGRGGAKGREKSSRPDPAMINNPPVVQEPRTIRQKKMPDRPI